MFVAVGGADRVRVGRGDRSGRSARSKQLEGGTTAPGGEGRLESWLGFHSGGVVVGVIVGLISSEGLYHPVWRSSRGGG